MTGLIPFEGFFGDRWLQSRNIASDVFKIDVMEKDNKYVVEAELPGIQKSEINLDAYDKMLSISVNREEKIDEEKENYIHRERRSSSMRRGVRLADANYGEITAKLDNGVLTVVVPKQDKNANSRKIEIQ
ncbi:MAG: Hsp20 family protein [Clostridiales bacterium]|nr:Hsp20 family protein [Clostridiales bacterium]